MRLGQRRDNLLVVSNKLQRFGRVPSSDGCLTRLSNSSGQTGKKKHIIHPSIHSSITTSPGAHGAGATPS